MSMDYNSEYAFENSDDEESDIVGVTHADNLDRVGWAQMFHRLPQAQLEILICRYLGFKPAEIVKILGYKNIVRYYNVSAKLRKIYREQKGHCLDYN